MKKTQKPQKPQKPKDISESLSSSSSDSDSANKSSDKKKSSKKLNKAEEKILHTRIVNAIEKLPNPEVEMRSIEADYQCFRYLVAIDDAQWEFDRHGQKLYWRILRQIHEPKVKKQKTKQK